MTELVIQCKSSADDATCTFCGGETVSRGSLQLYRADSQDVVCRDCGKAYAPSLVALIDLACTAERVGRIGRHMLVPPLSSLLALARAAEDYTFTSPRAPAHAA